MNVVLLEPSEATGTRVRVTGRRAVHIASVHRAAVGQTLRVGVVGGELGTGTVASVSREAVEMDVSLGAPPPPPLPCTLALALPRPRVLHRVLGLAAAIGIKRIALFGSRRVEKSYWASPVLGDGAIREQLLLGLEQGGDTIVPTLTMHRRFRPFVEDDFADLACGSTALLADVEADGDCPRADGRRVTLVVGPEGGLIDEEVRRFRDAGCAVVTLGRRPLRVEHAVAALLGRLF